MLDWKDALSQLRDELPEGEEQPQEEVSEPKSKKQGKLHVAIEKKGRAGKTATIIYGFECSDEEVAQVATTLKQRLGSGGSSRGGEILLQGDCRSKVLPLLKELGYKI